MRNALIVLVFCRRIPAQHNVFKYETSFLYRILEDNRLANIAIGIAYKAANMLGLDTEGGHACLNGANSTSDALPHWLKAEMARRCFWAVWFTQCINSDHSLVGLCLTHKVMSLPLPINETSFLRGQEASSVTLSAIVDKSSSTLNTVRPLRNSILGELMVAMQFW